MKNIIFNSKKFIDLMKNKEFIEKITSKKQERK